MSGCETTSLKYPDGSDLMSYEGCPVETIVYFCTNCEWMATQNTCTDEMLPQCLLDAFPYHLSIYLFFDGRRMCICVCYRCVRTDTTPI